VVFYAVNMESNLSPHCVLCAVHLAEANESLIGEALGVDIGGITEPTPIYKTLTPIEEKSYVGAVTTENDVSLEELQEKEFDKEDEETPEI
jgi:hypothetical protein